MDEEIFEEVDCPICIETLKKPIRMLLCGHNLCHECLEKLLKSSHSNQRCPTCRETIVVGKMGVGSLPRNRTLETLIERMTLNITEKNKAGSSQVVGEQSRNDQSTVSPNGERFEKMRLMATNYINENKFLDAVELLKEIEQNANKFEKINLLAEIANCYLETNDIAKATEACNEITSFFTEQKSDLVLCDDCADSDVNLRHLAKTLALSGATNAAAGLIRCSVDMAQGFYEGKDTLSKLGYSASVMQYIAKSMSKNEKSDEFKDDILPYMLEILRMMYGVDKVEETTKTLKIGWCYKYIGECCNLVKAYDKAVEYCQKGINRLTKDLVEEANQSRVLGHCYKIVGTAYENLKEQRLAESAYFEALEIYRRAQDWENTRQMEKCMALKTSDMNWDSSC